MTIGSTRAPTYTKDLNEGEQKTILDRFLDTNGDGSGSKEATGDYSITPDIFYIQPGADEVYRISRMIVSVGDTATMQAQEYGNLGSALANGVSIRIQDDSGTLNDLTDSSPVTTNAQWGSFCYDVDVKTWGAGNELLVVRWTFEKSGQYIRLDGSQNQRLEVVLNDSFTGLLSHKFMVQGYIE